MTLRKPSHAVTRGGDSLYFGRYSWRWILAAILLLAVLARLVYSLGVSRGLLNIDPELQSTDGYHLIAQTVLEGHGYRFSPDRPLTTLRPPGYPAFLLMIFSIAGVNYIWVQIAQAFLGAVSCWLLFLTGRWVLSTELGLAAAALCAVYPNSIEYSARLYCENLYFPLFLGFAYLLCRTSIEGSIGRGLAAGAVFGAGLLTRGSLLPLPLILPIGIAVSRPHRSPATRWLRWTLPAVLSVLLVVGPWTIRNYNLTGSFVPVSTWTWPPLYAGMQVAKNMFGWRELGEVDQEAVRYLGKITKERQQQGEGARTDTAQMEQIAREQVLAQWQADPVGMATRAVAGLGFAWFLTFGTKMRILSLAIHLPLFILFVTGAIFMARSHREAFTRAWPALGLIIFVNVFHAVAYPHIRYMTPAIALSFVFSALPIVLIARRIGTRWQGVGKSTGQHPP